jgi:hypothetical protein
MISVDEDVTGPFAEICRSYYDISEPDDEAIARANAAFIVTACNSHQALLAALKSLIDCGLQPDEVTLSKARTAYENAGGNYE